MLLVAAFKQCFALHFLCRHIAIRTPIKQLAFILNSQIHLDLFL